ncbi:hypothetical protein K431DRAFT_38186 [Polychaeton citri CBS 116435]|uniref:Uncharacterized protein n=1 Tax=Polychaeton citri CBS 116435 TaxID=1314669 RepID=A0A9P4QD08_9PEZI|nr:hypothetical protein K431DRAFT_38186 [Polychaeton citri CBS 116435]
MAPSSRTEQRSRGYEQGIPGLGGAGNCLRRAMQCRGLGGVGWNAASLLLLRLTFARPPLMQGMRTGLPACVGRVSVTRSVVPASLENAYALRVHTGRETSARPLRISCPLPSFVVGLWLTSLCNEQTGRYAHPSMAQPLVSVALSAVRFTSLPFLAPRLWKKVCSSVRVHFRSPSI